MMDSLTYGHDFLRNSFVLKSSNWSSIKKIMGI